MLARSEEEGKEVGFLSAIVCPKPSPGAAQGPEAATRKNTPTTGLQPQSGWPQRQTGGRRRSGAPNPAAGVGRRSVCLFVAS